MKLMKINETYRVVLITSLIVYAFRSLEYLLLGSYVPGMVLMTFGLLIASGMYLDKKWLKPVVKIWAVLMILFGLLRYALVAMLYFGHIDEVHILEQFTFLFNVVNMISIVSGVYLFKKSKKYLAVN